CGRITVKNDGLISVGSKKSILAMLACAALLVAGPHSTKRARSAGQLVFVATGGDYEKKIRKHYFDPFTAVPGIAVGAVSASTGESWAKVKSMSEGGRIEWDMMEAATSDTAAVERVAFLEDLGENCEKVPKAKSDALISNTCSRFGVVQ